MSREPRDKKRKIGPKLEHWQQISLYLIAYDIAAVTMSYFLALLLRYDFRFSLIPWHYFQPWKCFAPFYAAICVLVFWSLHLYRSIWRFASFRELERITLASIITAIIHIIGTRIVICILAQSADYTVSRMPISYYIMGAMLQFLLVTAVRFSYRFILLLRSARRNNNAKRVILVGVHSIIGTT